MLNAVDPLTQFADVVAGKGWTSLFPALEKHSQATIGHILFSCSVFRKAPGANWVAARVYSNDEKNYPTSGLKEIVPTRWTELVISQGKTFVANSVEQFSDVLADHVKIESMGLGSVVNLPVVVCGQFIGTVNLLHEAGYYTGARVSDLSTLTLPALLSFQLSELPADLRHAHDGQPS
ncbi:GAF domain-containing protein [Roseivivax sp. GX 12232]|uniref:GAF domain-containing protein n=1 Tax=Roseivivax sp. GX 12232 TaxID=2900547 RepID=UPI001E4B7362|nr:GAF domain-containing protein [Roseivivax sp. GX 12232]MCE0507313.1 GAF domain-containing protein [Roseivivax sp. GX 12232]